jgi:hypothetical protein
MHSTVTIIFCREYLLTGGSLAVTTRSRIENSLIALDELLINSGLYVGSQLRANG